jgi:hypothetical protein
MYAFQRVNKLKKKKKRGERKGFQMNIEDKIKSIIRL